MKTYKEILSPAAGTPQSEPLYGREADMELNAAGGYVFSVDDWTRFQRFVVLGSAEGSYYATPQKLTKENAKCVERCLRLDGPRVVRTIVDVSVKGRAPKNDTAILALAMAMKLGDDETRRLARLAVPEVCRIGTHIFQFAEAVQMFGGWGRGTRRAVADWYLDKPEDNLAFLLVKYRQRDGWSHRDLLRLAHPKTDSMAIKWAAGKVGESKEGLPQIIEGYERISQTTDEQDAVKLIRAYGLPREAVPTGLLNSKEVWEALLVDMPLTAMIRNLATMTRVGVIAPLSVGTGKVVADLGNAERLRKSRVHPMAILIALKTYAGGRGVRGSNTWTPVSAIVDALDAAFYAAFENVEPTGKRILCGIDCSGSMQGGYSGGSVMGIPGFSEAQAAAAMAVVLANTEPNVEFVGFTTHPVDLGISKSQRVDDVMAATTRISGGTDCAIPMLYATERNITADAHVCLTDNESWFSSAGHPAEVLKRYRKKLGIPAKFVSVAFTATGTSIADPRDAGILQVVGMSSDVPAVISDFIRE